MVKIGDVFGSLIVTNIITDGGRNRDQTICALVCNCGSQWTVYGNAKLLESGKINKCPYCDSKNKTDDIIGTKINMLFVLGRDVDTVRPKYYCKCDCGNIVTLRKYKLINNLTSCGCKRTIVLNNVKNNIKLKSTDDLTGLKFGKLTSLEVRPYRSKDNRIVWKCRCDCGNIVDVTAKSLISGNTTSCGCKRTPDLLYKKFGRLTILEYVETPENRSGRYVKCKCDCGNICIKKLTNITSGVTSSCGCLSKEVTANRSIKHGLHGTRIYNIWAQMHHRCYFTNDSSFLSYGAKGIKVCEEWHDVVKFKEWAETHGYRDDLSIDRIDINGNYCPENCRWIPLKEQAWNKSTNIKLKDGSILIQKCHELGISHPEVTKLIYTRHYSPDEALQYVLKNSV